ncbi:DUF7344 domain-containing protein [Halomontanus rarus]|uniref:DUF7344 domain-containing protein n=1 Tax=Halomontanus rarus TaxID=3034020 RepID=UPI003CE4573A
MISEQSHSETLDATYTLLSDSRRRHLLYCLGDDSQMTTEDLSLEIAAQERDVSTEAVHEDDRKRVEITLVHTHLPRLTDHDVLEVDSETGDVTTAERFAEIRPFVERARTIELGENATNDTMDRSERPADGERPFSD